MIRIQKRVAVVWFVTFSLCALGWYVYENLEGETCGANRTDDVAILFATHDIAAGQIVTSDMLHTKKVRRVFLPTNPLLTSDANIYLGSKVHEPIPAGQMVLTQNFTDPVQQRARIAADILMKTTPHVWRVTDALNVPEEDVKKELRRRNDARKGGDR